MCNHFTIDIFPTQENVWGIYDTFFVKCCDCGITLIEYATVKEIQKHLAGHKHRIRYGQKYIK